ncbi:uncharacterized protein LOC113869179 isoform X2 [Abrus precatorius]|uniref:Uncharacterized protein LOC113869179 isoform X2 n=1 Tax=Abrus precatorius TaxID=3816 RepID=A0A8B8M1V1_ABRPR|nr:uncharacterized protein LOC113869179 isoform X2 [Abrus precatorius]
MGKGVSREHFQPKTCSGKKDNFKNIVFIDVDSDQVDDVVIIDFPEFMSKLHGSGAPSRDRVFTPQSVISIDDDDDEESDDVERPGIVGEGVGELDSDASSSKRFSPESSGMRNSVHINVDNSVCEKDFGSNRQKSRKACFAKDTGRNHFGLDGCESKSSESDCSDCELMEREQWEKISLKRKRSVFNDQPSYNDHASSSRLHRNSDIYIDIDVENWSEQNEGGATYPGPDNGNYVKENQSSFSVKGDSQVDGTSKTLRSESIEEMQSLHRRSDNEHGKSTRGTDFHPCSGNKNSNFCSGVTGASWFNTELGGRESKFVNLSQEARERQVDNSGSALKSKDDNLSEANSNSTFIDERCVNCDGLALNDQVCGHSASNETYIINEREKLKETDEYKQAMEEEWASRQRQLQIQAEEAQRLRKRKKAESQRLLDMQRRQKERIEEVRETQKKDEEFMNLKEQLRVEVQKGLNELENQCRDMTSLLRSLGIHVGESFYPSPNEVHAAYRRALLKFHPDRASKTDIRQQVEAEEKFKLISRMKEKFLSAPFY